ncbi:SEC-C motif domain protein [Candidatus Accumulibacter phosphatis]|jgi:tetratricopeptide (TPR) repeat protein|uniref:SEC-C motif domain protein n=1 Tax=Accumulibacter regalis TaxID=522306 RepID=C7RUN1_ACCRE
MHDDHPWLTRHAKLADDPIMIEWAVRHFDLLPRQSAVREALAPLWFPDETLAHWIEGTDADILEMLFAILPVRRFASFAPLIAARWERWPDRLAEAATRVLAGIAPELAAEIFLRHLEKLQFTRAGAILARLDQLPPAAAMALADRLIPLAWGRDPWQRLALGADAFRMALTLDRDDAVVRLLDTLLADEGRAHGVEAGVRCAARAFFGHDGYADLFFERREGHATTTFRQLACLFENDAPIAGMDAVLLAEDPVGPALDLLAACHQRSPASDRAWKAISRSKTYAAPERQVALAGLVLAAVAATGERATIDTDGMALEQVLSLLALDVSSNIHYAPLVARLAALPRTQAAPALAQQLLANRETRGGVTLAQAMGELAWPESIPALIACLGDEDGDFLCEEAQRALVAIGEAARDALIRQWESLDESQRIYGLSVISAVGGEPVVEFAVEHYGDLLADDVARWCQLALATPDQRLLERLRPELECKHATIDASFYRLCRLLDASYPEAEPLRARIMRHRQDAKQRAALLDFALRPQPPSSLCLALRCPACGAANDYEVKGVVIGDLARNEMLLADEPACLACGELPEFDFEPSARATLLTAVASLSAADGASGSKPRSLIIADRVHAADGSRQSIPSACASLQEKLRRNPQDWRSWLELGKLWQQINRPRAAVSSLEKALALNPLALDAVIHLAETLVRAGKKLEALDVLEEAQKNSSRWQTGAARPLERRGEFTRLHNDLRRQLRPGDSSPAPIAAAAAAPAASPGSPVSPQKVGRNDACPCGSGKKYKKCCGA